MKQTAAYEAPSLLRYVARLKKEGHTHVKIKCVWGDGGYTRTVAIDGDGDNLPASDIISHLVSLRPKAHMWVTQA